MNWDSVLDWTREYYQRLHALRSEDFAFWADYVVFTWRWWVKVALLAAPWIVWFLVRKKDSSRRLLTAGMFVIAVSLLLDEIGTMLGLWFYSAKQLLPFFPGNFVYNVGVLPVATMLLIQWFPKIRPVYKALIFAAAGAFIAEPVMVWLGYYENLRWTYAYSFPILFGMYLGASRLAAGDRFEAVHKNIS